MADARSALALVNPWDVQIGRVDDADRVGPNRVPKPGASVEEINGYFLALDAKPGDGGFLASRPPFWEKVKFKPRHAFPHPSLSRSPLTSDKASPVHP